MRIGYVDPASVGLRRFSTLRSNVPLRGTAFPVISTLLLLMEHASAFIVLIVDEHDSDCQSGISY